MNKSKISISLSLISLFLITGCNQKSSSTDTGSTDTTPTDTVNHYDEGYTAGYEAGHSGLNKDYQGHEKENGYVTGYDEGYMKGKEDLEKENEEAGIKPGLNIETHTDKQASYIAGSPSNISSYADGSKEQCAPKPITLDYSNVQFEGTADLYTVRLSETEDFAKYSEYQTTAKSVNVTNLKLGTTYYWNVTGEKGLQEYRSKTYTFSTKQGTIRNLYVPGTTNWRDLGNFETSDGKRIKQGLIYRSAAFGFYDGETKSTIDQETINTIKYDFKIKSDIDLAGVQGIDGVNRYYYRMEYSGISNLIDDAGNKKSIKSVFETLGDSNKYPAVFHCTRGRDRTGAIAFLLEGYLGVSQEDLTRDYLFTNFSSSNSCNISVVNTYISYLNGFEGNTLQQKIESYLLSIGVTQSTLTNIESILK